MYRKSREELAEAVKNSLMYGMEKLKLIKERMNEPSGFPDKLPESTNERMVYSNTLSKKYPTYFLGKDTTINVLKENRVEYMLGDNLDVIQKCIEILNEPELDKLLSDYETERQTLLDELSK